MTITIPSPAKVFTLAGALVPPVAASRLRGELWKSPNTRQSVGASDGYVNIPLPGNGNGGRDAINTILHTHTPNSHVIIYGHSMGAQMIYKWLRDYGPTSDIDPATVTFVSTGNPERPRTGVSRVRPLQYPAMYGGVGFPAGTPYRVIDLARQYDFAADHPTATSNFPAMLNIGNLFTCPIHTDYTKVGINDPTNVVWVEGNVTYILCPTYPLKLLRGSEWRGKEYVMRRDQELRPRIETAYNRAKPVPLPDYWGRKNGEQRQRRTVTCTPGRPSFWAKIK